MAPYRPRDIDELSHGDHACLLVRRPQDQCGTVAAFLKAGLERGERSTALGDPLSLEAYRETLALTGVDVAAEEKRGALILTHRRDFLMCGAFDRDNMIRFIDHQIDDALRAGFSGLRAAGDVAWEFGASLDPRAVYEYETLADRFIRSKPFLALCLYRIASVPASYLCRALGTHPVATLGGTTCVKNAFYDPETPFSPDGDEEFEKRSLDRMCLALEAANPS